jgi:signal recognition particle subunit SRP54
MFERLTERLHRSFRNLIGQGSLTAENMQGMLNEVKEALIEADVALLVIDQLIDSIRAEAVGVEIAKHLSSGQEILKIVNSKLVELLGTQVEPLKLQTNSLTVVLMAGLQGSGKTTSVAKLSKWLKERQSKKVLIASADIYRPAAIEQLRTLAYEVGIDFFPSINTQSPVEIAKLALSEAKKAHHDVLIIDTAGRLHIDAAMMEEIKQIHAAITPHETLFVVDGMTGQDAAKTAKAFGEALPLTGVVVTKLDGDTRGGAILSVKYITQKPIKFIGTGEKADALEPFYPDRMASRILGMGDMMSLIEELERKVDKEQADKLAKKVAKGTFDLEDFRTQLLQMQNMGGMMGLMDKLPGMSAIPQDIKSKANDKALLQMVSIINSMTMKERKRPKIINGSRKRRIAMGSGTQIQDINKVIKQFEQMLNMMEKMTKKGGMAKMMKSLQARMPNKGGLPPGGFF